MAIAQKMAEAPGPQADAARDSARVGEGEADDDVAGDLDPLAGGGGVGEEEVGGPEHPDAVDVDHLVVDDGQAAIEQLSAGDFSLILMDCQMPVLDGYGVLHAVHKNESIKNTPFIFLTAKTERSDFRKGMELGADDFVTKPFSGTELLNAVDSRLNKIGLLKQELSSDLQNLQNLLKKPLMKKKKKS